MEVTQKVKLTRLTRGTPNGGDDNMNGRASKKSRPLSAVHFKVTACPRRLLLCSSSGFWILGRVGNLFGRVVGQTNVGAEATRNSV